MTFRRRVLPAFLQTETAECALACIAMIGAFHGHQIDLPGLRRLHPISQKGATLARVIEIAHALGLESRALRLELDDLAALKTPCILHWDQNHFVVLKRVRRGSIQIHDPAQGTRTVSMREVAQRFTGIALELTPAADFAPLEARARVSLVKLAGEVEGLLPALFYVALLALGVETFALMTPLYLQATLDQVLVSSDLGLLNLLAFAFLCIVVLQAVLGGARGWAITGIGVTLTTQWSNNLFGHLLRLPLEFFEKRRTGDLLSRFDSLQAIQHTLTANFVESMIDGLTAAFTLVLIALYSARLTLVVLAGFVLYASLRWLGYRRIEFLKGEQLAFTGRQRGMLYESLRGVRTIKLANQQSERQARMTNAVVEVANRDVGLQRTEYLFGVLGQAIFGTQRIVVIWLAARLVLEGALSAGMLVVFVVYADQFATRVRALIDKGVEFRLLGVHAARISDIALASPERHTESRYAGPAPEPWIEVENLSFRYAADEPWIFRNASFRVEKNESVALVGPSGSGKTTLAKLLLGLLTPEDGSIRVGGIDIRRYGLHAYRGLCAAVMQDDELLEGSIANNITHFDPSADLPAIEEAARLAAIHADIAAMPMGYETLVGDMGSVLSGGQKQRVLLARALYRKPRIMVLDEATSHLDVANEQRVNAAVGALDITRVIIAHRPETIASADRVLLVRDGAVRVRAPSIPPSSGASAPNRSASAA